MIGLVVSSCIGSGVFALTGQLANAASPGAALLAWLICVAGFLFLALSISNVGAKLPDFGGICAYAEDRFAPFHGFSSVCDFWLFSTMLPAETSLMMSEHHLLPAFLNKMNVKGTPQMALLVVGVLMTGWSFLLLTCLPGFFHKKARHEARESLSKRDRIIIVVFGVLAVVPISLTAAGVISVF